MVRRSAPILLGLVVCLLFAVHPSGASPALRLDESKIRVSLEEAQTRVSLEVESGAARTFGARVTLALLDPHDKVRAEASSDVSVRPGKNTLAVPIKLPYSELLEVERSEFPWYRLRYSVAPEGGAAAAAEGIVSLSEVTPDLFELRVVASRRTRAGSQLRTRVRTFNPVTNRPVKGVAVAGELKFATEDAAAKSSAVTGGDGFATLDFRVPPAAEDEDEGELKITARRGVFADSATAGVSVEQHPRVILTTDKSLYQPGQTLHARALVFDPSDRAMAGSTVTLKLDDEPGETVFTAEVKTSRYGIATADWPIPESAKLGTYLLTVKVGGEDVEVQESAGRAVRISRYDLPNFTVTTKTDRTYYLAGQNAEIEIRGDYLFGQPVKRGRVRLVRQTERHWDYEEQKYVTEEQDPIEGVLDEQGRFVAHVDFSEEHKELADSSYRRFEDLSYAAYVTDATTNRTEQRRFDVRLTKEPIHVYVNEGRYRQSKGLPLAFYLSASYADGTPAECEVAVMEEGETSVTRVAGEPSHEVKEPDKPILKVKTNRYGVAKVFGPRVDKDDWRPSVSLLFVARDREGRTGRHNENFWFERYYRREAPEIRVETDKTIYREGEPVTVEVASDTESLSAVADVAVAGRTVYSKPLRISGGRASFVVPYNAEFRDAVNISVTGTELYGADEDVVGAGSRTVVFPRDRELKLDVRMSRAKYQPGDDAVAQMALRTPAGRRAEGALGVVVFDKAVEERARTDGESPGAWGFGDSLYGYLYDSQTVAGFTQRDIERLDAARPVPAGLDEVAELLYNAGRDEYGYESGRRVFGGTHFQRSHAEAFRELVAVRLAPVYEALNRRYIATAEYPTDADSLSRMLSAAGVDFAALRDPWGRPFRAEFYVEGPSDVLAILSDGMDKRADTDDDFRAAGFARHYFRKTSEAIERALKSYHSRAGGFVRDRRTLAEELRREGVDLEGLRDPWGQAYSFEFDATGTHYRLIVRSSGPNKSFEPRNAESSDDFTVSTTLTDYFEETRAAIDVALARSLRETALFPATGDELRAALKRRQIDFDALRDGWDSKPYAVFATSQRFADMNAVRYRVGVNASDTQRTVTPVTQILRTVTVRSPGPDRLKGTEDDFTLGYYASLAAEQSGHDATPQAAPRAVVFEGGTGAISGNVTDPNGAAVPGAKVTAKHRLIETTFTAETGDDGSYLLRNLPSGFYDLTCESPGFMVAAIREVQVQSANLTKVDITMNLAGASEVVTVAAAGSPEIQTTSASVSEVKVAPPARMPLSTPRLRDFFPETLVWQPAVETDSAGRAEVRFKLADNITTWKMSVIASTEDGRVGTYEKEFISSQPFFVEHDPPRVLTEGDRISLPVVLRNYLERAQAVEVEMKPESWFALEGPARRREEVRSGEAARPTFDFRAVASVKDGKQRVTALGPDASDAVEKPVTVHPDGEERAATASAIILDAGSLSFNVPADAVRGSTRSELKLYPSLAAHLLEGVEAIMKRPYGCGEQTISSSYPSLLVLGYFEKDGELDEANLPPVGKRALLYTRQGYERLMRYRAPGGGFTYWGYGEPDLALTAYALRFLYDASDVIEVDEDVIKETRAWLVSKQRADGSWPAHRWQGDKEDSRQTAITTAFITRVLAATRHLEQTPAPSQTAQTKTPTPVPTQASTPTPQTAAARKQNEPAPTPLERALRYLAARASEIDEPYLIASYALASADAGDGEAFALAVRKLVALAHEEGDGSFWELQTNTPFYGWGQAGRVETTALALKALGQYCGMRNAECGVKNGERGAAASPPPANPKSEIRIPQLIDRGLIFLLRNKDRYGVWYSTQATVNVHDALLSLVNNVGNASGGTAEIFVNGRRAGALDLPPANQVTGPLSLDLTPYVNAGDNRVEVRRANGSALAQAQAVTTYYVPWAKALSNDTPDAPGAVAPGGQTSAKSGDASSLRLSVSYDRTSGGISQEVTCNVLAERVGHRGYGMMLAEVGLPPGADVDRESLDKTVKESGWSINSYDILPDRVVLYLWPAGGGTKFSFKFKPRYGLDALTAPSTLYDYYNPEAHAVVAPTRFVVR